MFFEKEMLNFNISGVLELNQGKSYTVNNGRNFSALAFRLKSDAILKTPSEEYYVSDNFISFVPAGIDYERISKFDKLIAVHFDFIDYIPNQIELFLPENPYVISKLFHEVLDCWNKKDFGYRYRSKSLLYSIFNECYAQNFKANTQDSKIQNSINYITENYRNKNFSIKEASARSFMSEVYFRKLFKEEYGVSPKKYVIELRIHYAADLISSGYYSLKEISDLCGYNDYKHFSTEFKRLMGVSPFEYSTPKSR